MFINSINYTNERDITQTTKEFDNVRDVINDFHQKYFTIVNSKFIKLIIVVFDVVQKQNSFFQNLVDFVKKSFN